MTSEMPPKERNLVYHPRGHIHDFMEYSEDLGLLKMASPVNHHSTDV